MKKSISVLITAILLVMSFALVVCAENFVPSIGYKPAPGISDDKNGCIIVTSVSEAKNTVKIPREVAEDLLSKYGDISKDGFELSSLSEALNKLVGDTLGSQYDADSLVIRDFFNIYSTCEDFDKYIGVDGQTVVFEFDIDVDDKPVFVLVYSDGEWVPANVTNTDGKLEIEFEELGHVAVMVPVDGYEDTPQTGDTTDNTVWFVVMFAALAAIVALVVANRKTFKLQRSN